MATIGRNKAVADSVLFISGFSSVDGVVVCPRASGGIPQPYSGVAAARALGIFLQQGARLITRNSIRNKYAGEKNSVNSARRMIRESWRKKITRPLNR